MSALPQYQHRLFLPVPQGNIKTTIGLHIWQKSARAPTFLLFRKANNELDIPGETFTSKNHPGDLTLHQITLHLLEKPLRLGQIRNLQFLDLLRNNVFASKFDVDDAGTKHLHVPVMLSADVDLAGEVMEIQHVEPSQPASLFGSLEAFTMARLDEFRRRTNSVLERGDLGVMVMKRAKLMKHFILQRGAQGVHAALRSTLYSLLAIAHIDQNELFSGAGCGMFVIDSQTGAPDGISMFLGDEHDRADVRRATMVIQQNIQYQVLLAFEWDDEGWQHHDKMSMVEVGLDGLLENDGRFKVEGWFELNSHAQFLMGRSHLFSAELDEAEGGSESGGEEGEGNVEEEVEEVEEGEGEEQEVHIDEEVEKEEYVDEDLMRLACR